MIIAFAGHSTIPMRDDVKRAVKEQILKKLGVEPIKCYIGGYGSFDEICAQACRELKREHKNIEIVYVAPYFRLSEQEKIKDMQRYGLCDTSIYPPLESVPPRFAISKRNEWMMKSADFVIAYVKRDFGGAYNSLQIAKRNKKQIINIFDLLQY